MGKRKRSGSFSKTDDGGAKKSDDCAEDSQEELDLENPLSSARNINNATRCSARVQEKQEKLRRESSPSKQILALEINCISTPSGSTPINPVKGNGKYPSPSFEESCAISDHGPLVAHTVGFEEKRKKRNWELWSVEDKQLFFEALNEYGKDFDAIQNYLATKLKPRSKAIICSNQYAAKNKDQVRHFYYRTWNKISKHLRFPSDMKKVNQELYGLINYGELRKKQRVLNSKSAAKLCELVENGITSIKFRGKTCRIKTPVCRALKRLNGLDDIEHTRVPNKVGLEFVPKDCKTWRSVQGLSHNPRVKVFVTLQRTLASVISFFENKWKRHDDRLKQQFSSVFGKPRPQLRFLPIDKRELSIPLYRVAENTSSATICLRSYTQNILVRERHDDNATIPSLKIKRKRKQSGSGALDCGNIDPNCNLLSTNKKSDALDYCPADTENSDVETQYGMFCCVPTGPHRTTASVQTSSNIDSDFRFPDEQSNEMAWMRFQQKWLDEEEQQDNLNSILFGAVEDNPRSSEANNLATETDNDEADHEGDEAEASDKLCECGSGRVAQSENFVSHVWDDERAKRGWTAVEAGVMTIGEIYLMLGQTEKICFEYCWDTHEGVSDSRNHRLIERLISTAKILKRKKSARSKTTIVGSSTSCRCVCGKCGIKMETPLNFSSISRTTPPQGILQTTSDQSQLRNKFQATNNTFETPPSAFSGVIPLDSLCRGNTPNPSAAAVPSVQDSTAAFLQYFSSAPNTNEDAVERSSAAANTITLNKAESESRESSLSKNNCIVISGCQREELITPIINQTNDIILPQQQQLMNIVNNSSPGGLIELCSLATTSQDSSPSNRHLAPNIKATLLPASSTIVKAPNGSITVNYGKLGNASTNDNPKLQLHGESSSQQSCSPSTTIASNKDQVTFHRPTTLRPLEPAVPGQDHEFPPPKPFVDLSKGNRRLGRRPNYKRVVIPRVLPLLPKPNDVPILPAIALGNNLVGNSVTLMPATTPTIITVTETPKPDETIHVSGDATPSVEIKSGGLPTTTGSDDDKQDITPKATTATSSSKTFGEAFMRSVTGSISCSSNDFEDLLKVRRHESNISNVSAGDMDNLSLSSFMEISLPESARMAANEINNELRIEDLDNSNCSVNLSNLLNSGPKLSSMKEDLSTPESSPRKQPPFSNPAGSSEGLGLSSLTNFENPWTLESGDMSLSTIFGQFDAGRANSGLPEGDVNFQTMMNDGSLDFGMKLELTSQMSDNRK